MALMVGVIVYVVIITLLLCLLGLLVAVVISWGEQQDDHPSADTLIMSEAAGEHIDRSDTRIFRQYLG